MLDIGGSTGVVAGHFAQTFGLTGTLIDPAPLEVRGGARLRSRDDHRAGRGVRLRRAPVRSGADLPDGRSPARRRRHAEARARAADTERLPVHRHRGLPRGVSAQLVGGGRHQDRSPVLPDAGDDDRVPAARGIREHARRLRGGPPARQLSVPPDATGAAGAARRRQPSSICFERSATSRTRHGLHEAAAARGVARVGAGAVGRGIPIPVHRGIQQRPLRARRDGPADLDGRVAVARLRGARDCH